MTKIVRDRAAQAANSTAAMIVNPRPRSELRAAQVAIASSVIGQYEGDENEFVREFELRDVLEYLGLYRRL